MSEVELAKSVVQWLKDNCWTVYQEVKCANSIADIVAVNGKLVWIIECKKTFGLRVLEQSYKWYRYSHFRSVAIPKPKGYRGADGKFRKRLLDHFQLGLIHINEHGKAYQEMSPYLNRKPISLKRLRDSLCDEQKTYASAGNSNGDFWSPFKSTRKEVEKYVKENPGCFYKQMMDSIGHHYANDSSARANVRYWIHEGVIRVNAVKDGRYLRLYPMNQ